jgi:hypothetical protein
LNCVTDRRLIKRKDRSIMMCLSVYKVLELCFSCKKKSTKAGFLGLVSIFVKGWSRQILRPLVHLVIIGWQMRPNFYWIRLKSPLRKKSTVTIMDKTGYVTCAHIYNWHFIRFAHAFCCSTPNGHDELQEDFSWKNIDAYLYFTLYLLLRVEVRNHEKILDTPYQS